jgi:hypothetical protein
LILLVLGVVTLDGGVTLAGSPVSLARLIGGSASQPVEASARGGADPEGWAPGNTADQGVPRSAGPITTDPYVLSLIPTDPAPPQVVEDPAGGEPEGEVVTVNVLDYGYEPQVVRARAGVPVKLRLVSENVYSCALAFSIPSLRVQTFLKPTGETWIDIPAQAAGTSMPFSCSMGMFTGTIVFDL